MLTESGDALRARAIAIAASLPPGAGAEVIPGESEVGGGSFPGAKLTTWLVRLAPQGPKPDALAQRFREASPPIIARIADDHVVLDPRTILDHQMGAVAAAVTASLV
jgi:L-seryl-tRNA(Ser) seleniumtransferase